MVICVTWPLILTSQSFRFHYEMTFVFAHCWAQCIERIRDIVTMCYINLLCICFTLHLTVVCILSVDTLLHMCMYVCLNLITRLLAVQVL